MPFNVTRTAAIYEREILRVVNGSEVAENAVIDATTVAVNGDGRRVLEKGSVMVYVSGAGSKVKLAPTSAVVQADVAGILRENVEFFSEPAGSALTSAHDKPVALWTKNCNFETSQLTNYSGNAAAVKAAMAGAGNGRTANCTFE